MGRQALAHRLIRVFVAETLANNPIHWVFPAQGLFVRLNQTWALMDPASLVLVLVLVLAVQIRPMVFLGRLMVGHLLALRVVMKHFEVLHQFCVASHPPLEKHDCSFYWFALGEKNHEFLFPLRPMRNQILPRLNTSVVFLADIPLRISNTDNTLE